MNRIRNSKPPKRLRLQPAQLLPTMIHSPTDPAVLPPRMRHLAQPPQLLPHLLLAPSLRRQRQMPLHARAGRHELLLELEDGVGDLGLDLGAHAGEPQEERVQDAAGGAVEGGESAEGSEAANGVKGLAGPAEEEEDEDEVADAVCQMSDWSFSGFG